MATVAAQQVQYSHGDPSALEQQMLELINRARMNPTQEGTILDALDTWYSRDARYRKPSFFTYLRSEFGSYPAVPPLAMNANLLYAAAVHSQDMINRGYIAHVNPEGKDPTARAAAAGYGSGVGENIDGGGASSADEVMRSHFSLLVDYDNADVSHALGHRLNVLNSSYTEVGVGIRGVLYGGRITQDFGSPARSNILGVAYNDANGNGMYDPGEGLAGVTVRPNLGNWYAVTSSSGGFAIPVDPVETVTDNVNLGFAVQSTPWSQVQPYDLAYRQQQVQNAPSLTVQLTWSGGPLPSPKVSTVAIKRPVLRNYHLTGTDGYFYALSMVTTQNVKADCILSSSGSVPLSGIPDFVFQNTSGQIVGWRLNGAGAPVGAVNIFLGILADWRLVGTADLNNDRIPDFVFQNTAGHVVGWLMNAAGAPVGTVTIYGGSLGDWKFAASGDLNKDGIPDLVFQNTAGQVVGWLMNGSGALTGGVTIFGGSLGDWRVRAMGDLNGDGIPDLVFQDTAGQIAGWLMNGSGAVTSGVMIYSGALSGWRVCPMFDLNRDGIADLVFQGTSGQITGWLMNGSGGANAGVSVFGGSLGDWRVR